MKTTKTNPQASSPSYALQVTSEETVELTLTHAETLNIAIYNKQKERVVFVTNEPAYNDLTVKLKNGKKKDLKFTGGSKPVKSGETNGPSCIYIKMGKLLSNAEDEAIELTEQCKLEWVLGYFVDEDDEGYLAICPRQDRTLANNKELEFQLTKITPSKTKEKADVLPAFERVNGVIDYYSHSTFSVKPHPEDKPPLLLSSSFFPNRVEITAKPEPVQNKLTLTLHNPSEHPLVPADVPWPTDADPLFRLTFVIDDRSHHQALTTVQYANNIHTTAPVGWKIVPQMNVEHPYWELKPEKSTNHHILEGEASVSFTFENVITEFEAGFTPYHIDSKNIPKYREGHFSGLLKKVDSEPTIEQFTVAPTQVDYGQTVTFEWDAYGGDKCRLEKGDGTIIEDNIEMGEGKFEYKADIPRYVLRCLSDSAEDAKEVVLTINPPRIEQPLSATPPTVEYGGDTTLAWKLNSTKAQFLSKGNQARQEVPAEDERKVENWTTTTEFKLVGEGIGASVESLITVNVNPPTIKTFSTSRSDRVFYKEKVTLSWETSGGEYELLENGHRIHSGLPSQGSIPIKATPPASTGLFPTAVYSLQYQGDFDLKRDLILSMIRFNAIFLIDDKKRYMRQHLTKTDITCDADLWHIAEKDNHYWFYLVPDKSDASRTRFQVGVMQGLDKGAVWCVEGERNWDALYIHAKTNATVPKERTLLYITDQSLRNNPDRIRVHFDEWGTPNGEYLTNWGQLKCAYRWTERSDQLFKFRVLRFLNESDREYQAIATHFGDDWG